MTIKQKFNSIDQSKLTADQKAFLTKIKDVTKNFTDSEMNKKVEAPLNGFIEKAKEKMPEAIKSAPVKRTAKATASQTKKPKRTAMSLAKEIRKEGESWNDARARASKMMKEDSKDLSKTVETELDKLSKLVRGQKNKAKLVGISGTNIKRDASRKAKPRGLRTVTNSGETSNQYGTFNNKLGRKYYENRDRHSDRLAPNYPKNSPYLAGGGGVGDYDVKLLVGRRLVYEKKSNTMTKAQNIANEIFSFADDGFDYTIVGYDSSNNKLFEKKRMMANDLPNSLNVNFNSLKLLVTVLDPKQTKLDVGSFTSYKSLLNVVDDFEENNFRITINGKTIEEEFARGGGVRQVGNREYSYGRNWTNDHRHLNKDEDHEVKYTRKKKFELGGTVVSDLAGHTGGGDGGLNAGMPLSGFSNTGYTGLVGETGAMSSGEMFMNGGGLPSGSEQSYMITESLGNPAQHYARGGGVGDYDVKLLVGRRLVYEKKSNTMTKAQNIANEIFSFADDGFDYTIVGYDSSNNKLFEKKRMMANDLPNSLNVNFNSLKLLVTVLDPKQTKLDAGSFTSYKSLLNVVDDFEENNFRITINGKTIEEEFARGGGVRKVGNREYSYGRNWTNDHRHLNKDEDHEVKYTRKGKFMGIFADGGKMAYGGGVGETPRIYVADLEAYNNGKLVGEWLDLADYNDADELMDAIQDVLKKSGGEEYAIHDVEYIPSSMYSEYMGRKDFEELYEMIDLAKQNDLPLEVVQEVVSQYSASAVDDFVGKYDSAEDFAEQLVDEMGGLENFSSPEYYVDITNTDRRLLAGEMADSYVDDIRDEDGGNRVIEQSGLDLDEYEEADSERQQEMLDEAVEIVREEYYDTWYEGLSDPYEFLVEEQGMYSPEDLFNASFIRIDYEKLARDLEQDYTFIQYDGSLYVFNIR